MNESCSVVWLFVILVPSVACIAGVWLMAKEHEERARTHTRRKEDRRLA